MVECPTSAGAGQQTRISGCGESSVWMVIDQATGVCVSVDHAMTCSYGP